MKRIIVAVLLLITLPALATNKNRLTHQRVIGKEVKDFTLADMNGRQVNTAAYKNAKGIIVVFTCNHCPFAKLYTDRLNAINAKYGKMGIPLLAINPMDTAIYEEETLANMQQCARERKFAFTYLEDPAQIVAKQFAATHTPSAYILWKENGKWIIKYSGAVDNNGEHPELATPYLTDAVDELLQGKTVSKDETSSVGCAITYKK